VSSLILECKVNKVQDMFGRVCPLPLNAGPVPWGVPWVPRPHTGCASASVSFRARVGGASGTSAL